MRGPRQTPRDVLLTHFAHWVTPHLGRSPSNSRATGSLPTPTIVITSESHRRATDFHSETFDSPQHLGTIFTFHANSNQDTPNPHIRGPTIAHLNEESTRLSPQGGRTGAIFNLGGLRNETQVHS